MAGRVSWIKAFLIHASISEIQAMQELDVNLSANTSISLEQFKDEPFDLVVTSATTPKNRALSFQQQSKPCIGPLMTRLMQLVQKTKMYTLRRVRDEIKAKILTDLSSLITKVCVVNY